MLCESLIYFGLTNFEEKLPRTQLIDSCRNKEKRNILLSILPMRLLQSKEKWLSVFWYEIISHYQ